MRDNLASVLRAVLGEFDCDKKGILLVFTEGIKELIGYEAKPNVKRKKHPNIQESTESLGLEPC